MKALEQIHMSLVNGQNKQAAAQIEDYGVAAFACDYPAYLNEFVDDAETQLTLLTKAFRAYAYNI